MRDFDSHEEYQLGRSLERHHGVFNMFWGLVRPRFSNSIPTAAVAFNKAGDCIDFIVNEEFWGKQTFKQKQFIIAHECLHVLLSHGLRSINIAVADEDKRVANVAMDVVVNSLLQDRFGFDRELVDPIRKIVPCQHHKADPELAKKLGLPEGAAVAVPGEPIMTRMFVWRDNVLKDQVLPPNRSFEFYFNLLLQKREDMQFSDSADGHEGLGDIATGKAMDKIKEMMEGMSADELESFKDMLQRERERNGKEFQEIFPEQTGKSTGGEAGSDPGNFLQHIRFTPVIKKKKWETVIRHWVRKLINYKDEEQWAQKSRRSYNIFSDCFIPSEIETEEASNEKVTLLLFQDTSGSCVHLAERFFKAARSIPQTKFDLHTYCFDTEVYPIDLKKGDLKGFGGTCFQVIDKEVRRMEAKYGKVYTFIVTDGFGTKVAPEHPDRWFWFLSENERSCFPESCHAYNLADFE